MRIVYFVISPFPWDIKKSSHILGMIDGFLYIFLTYLILCNRKIIWANPALRIILLILLAYIFVYGISIGNFGTGICHRSKFVIMFILLYNFSESHLYFVCIYKVKTKVRNLTGLSETTKSTIFFSPTSTSKSSNTVRKYW